VGVGNHRVETGEIRYASPGGKTRTRTQMWERDQRMWMKCVLHGMNGMVKHNVRVRVKVWSRAPRQNLPFLIPHVYLMLDFARADNMCSSTCWCTAPPRGCTCAPPGLFWNPVSLMLTAYDTLSLCDISSCFMSDISVPQCIPFSFSFRGVCPSYL